MFFNTGGFIYQINLEIYLKKTKVVSLAQTSQLKKVEEEITYNVVIV